MFLISRATNLTASISYIKFSNSAPSTSSACARYFSIALHHRNAPPGRLLSAPAHLLAHKFLRLACPNRLPQVISLCQIGPGRIQHLQDFTGHSGSLCIIEHRADGVLWRHPVGEQLAPVEGGAAASDICTTCSCSSLPACGN